MMSQHVPTVYDFNPEKVGENRKPFQKCLKNSGCEYRGLNYDHFGDVK